ncbi:hypothetical protein AKJ16_DCAP21133 [Drosera capensis]
MAEEPAATLTPPSPPPPPENADFSLLDSPPKFDPSRSIIRRKALIRDLAAVYHAECLAYCQQLLQLQKEWQETCIDIQVHEDTRKDMRPTKRAKKGRYRNNGDIVKLADGS